MFVIEDEAHAEPMGEYPTLASAMAELRRLSELAWDAAPNVAPCTNWRACGRVYELIAYDDAKPFRREVSRVSALTISAEGTRWLLHDPAAAALGP